MQLGCNRLCSMPTRCPSNLRGIDSDLSVGSSVGQRVGADIMVGLHIGNGLNTDGDTSIEVRPVALPRSRIIRRHRSRWSRRCYGRATQHSSYLAASAFAMSVKPRASVCLWLTSESERRSACESAHPTAAASVAAVEAGWAPAPWTLRR